MTTTLHGYDAIEYAEARDLPLNKHTDPTEGALDGLHPDQAREIASEDPSLIWIDVRESDLTTFGGVQFTTVDACVDAICESWLTADGTNHADTVQAMLAESTDADLVDELRADWALPHDRAALIEGMARLRARLGE